MAHTVAFSDPEDVDGDRWFWRPIAEGKPRAQSPPPRGPGEWSLDPKLPHHDYIGSSRRAARRKLAVSMHFPLVNEALLGGVTNSMGSSMVRMCCCVLLMWSTGRKGGRPDPVGP